MWFSNCIRFDLVLRVYVCGDGKSLFDLTCAL